MARFRFMPFGMPFAVAAASMIGVAAACGATPCGFRSELLRYNGYAAGLKIAEMTIENGVSSNSLPTHRFSVRSAGLVRLFSSVESDMSCERLGSDENACSVFTRRYHDRAVDQNDVMRLWPATGLAVREMLDTGESVTSRVEIGSQDVATFFCNIGSLLEDGAFDATNGIVRKVILDGLSHEVAITLCETGSLRTAIGRAPARAIIIDSRSDKLFSRNRPKRVWLSADYPVFLEMDLENRYGTQRFRLVEWMRDGRPFRPFQ